MPLPSFCQPMLQTHSKLGGIYTPLFKIGKYSPIIKGRYSLNILLGPLFGLKATGGENINEIMHAQNGNKRNLGYKIAAWNCNRGLLTAKDNESDKLVDIKVFIEENKPHLLRIIEAELHGPN